MKTVLDENFPENAALPTTTRLAAVCQKWGKQQKKYPVLKFFYGRSWVEYIPGDLNLIITVPHNGKEKPEGLEDR